MRYVNAPSSLCRLWLCKSCVLCSHVHNLSFTEYSVAMAGQGAGLGKLPTSEYHFTLLPWQGNGSPSGQQAFQQDAAGHTIDAAHIRGLQG